MGGPGQHVQIRRPEKNNNLRREKGESDFLNREKRTKEKEKATVASVPKRGKRGGSAALRLGKRGNAPKGGDRFKDGTARDKHGRKSSHCE